MHDRRDDRRDHGRSRRDHDDGHRRRGDEHGDEHRHDRGRGDDRGPDRGGGRGPDPDTRFLQLEMSKLLYAEAESVTRQAIRELLLEKAKARVRERFGDQITGLAQLAVDELLHDISASLDIEARIRERSRDDEGRGERLSDILGAGRQGADADETPEANGHDGGSSNAESDEDR